MEYKLKELSSLQIIEYLKMKGTYKNHPVQLPAPRKTT